MKDFRYIENVATLELDKDTCIGCGLCATVCPHRIFELQDKKAEIVDFNACIECGACAMNCPVKAITVTPGTGCAALILSVWLHELTGGKVGSGLGSGCC